MIDVEERLRGLGPALELDAPRLVGGVLARLADATDATDGADAPRARGRWMRVAAVSIALVGLVAIAVPSSRRTLADWFGLDGVEIERQPDLSVPSVAPALDPSDAVDGPGESEIVTLDGRNVLVSTIDGSIDGAVVSKTIGASTNVIEVDVGGSPGLWIDGRPHELAVRRGGEIVFVRIAGSTLIWQDGPVIRRVEGFDTLADALAYAEGLTP